jgi:hypothetical protein
MKTQQEEQHQVQHLLPVQHHRYLLVQEEMFYRISLALHQLMQHKDHLYKHHNPVNIKIG